MTNGVLNNRYLGNEIGIVASHRAYARTLLPLIPDMHLSSEAAII